MPNKYTDNPKTRAASYLFFPLSYTVLLLSFFDFFVIFAARNSLGLRVVSGMFLRKRRRIFGKKEALIFDNFQDGNQLRKINLTKHITLLQNKMN